MFLTNPVFVSIFFAWLLAGLLKYVLAIAQGKKASFASDLVRTGGMPSGHTALVVALSFSVLFAEGFGSLFLACAVFSAIVIRDSFGVRFSVGQQAKVLNDLVKHDHLHEKVKVVAGHTLWEVAAGSLLGVAIAVAVNLVV